MPGSPSQVGGGGAAGSLDAWVLWVGGEVPQIPASPPPSPRPLGSPPIGIEASPDAWVPPSGHLGAPPGHLGVPPGHLGAPHPGHPGPTHLRQPGGATSSPVALVYHGTNWGVGRGSWNNRDPTITHPHTPPPAAAALDAWVVPPPPPDSSGWNQMPGSLLWGGGQWGRWGGASLDTWVPSPAASPCVPPVLRYRARNRGTKSSGGRELPVPPTPRAREDSGIQAPPSPGLYPRGPEPAHPPGHPDGHPDFRGDQFGSTSSNLQA